jgi:hypothetical protein
LTADLFPPPTSKAEVFGKNYHFFFETENFFRRVDYRSENERLSAEQKAGGE